MIFRMFRYLPVVTVWLPVVAMVLVSAGCSVKDPVITYQGELPTDQVVHLKVQEGLQVLAVDDQRLKAPYVPDRGYNMLLKPGVRVVSVYYTEFWGDPTSVESITTEMYHFKMEFKPGQKYFLQHNAPVNKSDAINFPTDFAIWIKDPNQSEKVAAVSTSPYESFVNRGIQGLAGADTSGGLPPKGGQPPTPVESSAAGATGTTGTSASGSSASVVTAATAGAAAASSSSTAGDSRVEGDGRNITILDELKAVWDDATEEDKSGFRKWIVDHP